MHCDDKDVRCIVFRRQKNLVSGRYKQIQRVEIKTDIFLLHQQSYNRIYYILLCGFSMYVHAVHRHTYIYIVIQKSSTERKTVCTYV